jgi:hypothetical protein
MDSYLSKVNTMTDKLISRSGGGNCAVMNGGDVPAVPVGQVFQAPHYLGRKAAAQYITDNYFPCSPKTLAKLACVGGGPEFRKAGRIPIHEPLKLDVWARSRIGPPIRSTSDRGGDRCP